MNREVTRALIWRNIQRQKTFSCMQIAELVGCDDTTVLKYCHQLLDVGAIRVETPRTGKHDRTIYACLDLLTPWMPLVLEEDCRDKLWRSILIQGLFTVKTLQLPTGASRDLVAHYLGCLIRHGICRKEAGHESGKKDSYCLYRLVRNLGPQKPICGKDWLFDQNSCEFLEETNGESL